MKKLILFLLLTLNSLSQNLVPNPSFEVYDSCPVDFQFNPYVSSWYNPYLDTDPNYFNSCSVDFGVPSHLTDGYQLAKSGSAYSGIFTLNNFGIEYREFIQSELLLPLNNSCYYIEFYVNLYNNMMYGINNMSLLFSLNAVNFNFSNLFSFNPQIYKFGNPIISDTLNWVKVAGIYEAQGGEQYLTIGNFKTDEETDTVIFDPNAYDAAFYYIDDVSVISINPSSMPANAGVDKQVIVGDSVFIGQEISNLNCTWRTLDGTVIGTNTSGLYVKPTQTTSYVVEQNLCGVISYDTVEVTIGYLGTIPPLEGDKGGGLLISPNPNNGSFELLNLGSEVLPFSIRNSLGQVIYQDVLLTETKKVNLSLAKGVYFLTTNTNGRTEKIVVR